ncbi:MAG: TonB-dependent receptor [Geobacteraceae bacterium]|nr:TonB-dependent receptor [Geobacteraceae bacterium]NTW80385.1 TonB-dependent receptor [Geobacteraceae bacterium]
MKLFSIYLLPYVLALFLLSPSFASAAPDSDLTDLPLESLMELMVTSVSKKSQPITNAAAAVFVISQEDIRRSGVTTIADALRMAPGVQVAKIDSNKWAITSRGFNGRFANKLLVLMDGRSLYTPYFMGVYWEIQDTVLDDIDRIEVIRGPGAALWGANAVNGVINIITKSAENTKGTLLTAGGGSYEKAFASARVGTTLGEKVNIRLYAKHNQRDSFELESGTSSNDKWHTTRGGFRLDAQPNVRDTITLQGDYYDGRLDETYKLYDHPASSNPPYERDVNHKTAVNGGNILSRWQRTLSDTNSLSLQLYFDHSENNMLVSPQTFNTVDLDFQQRFSLGTQQEIVWGLGYRYNKYELINTPTLVFDTTNVTNDIYSAFLHDEISLIPSKLSLIIGSRFEQNDYSGFSVQPNGRLLWIVTPRDSLWGSVSRAVRSSTKSEQDVNYNYRTLLVPIFPNQPPTPLKLEINGNQNFKSEELLAYEIGYRTEVMSRLSIDVALYYNVYKNLRVITPGTLTFEGNPLYAVQPYILSNDMHGRAIGVELAADWTPLDWWRLQAAYSYQKLKMQLDGASEDEINKGNAEGDTPRHQLSVRSGFDMGRQVTLDFWLRGTDRLASIDENTIAGYVTMDARLAWKPVKNLELSIVGQNLFHNRHPEFIPEYINTQPSEVVRSAYGKVTWKY